MKKFYIRLLDGTLVNIEASYLLVSPEKALEAYVVTRENYPAELVFYVAPYQWIYWAKNYVASAE